MRILVVEDERKIAGFLERGLTDAGHRVVTARDIATARLDAAGAEYDVVVVDRMLPDGDGLSFVRDLRRSGDQVPVLCLTARDRVAERVQGLRDGADDYLVKPFDFEELLARVEAVARRGRGTGTLAVADLVIDVPARRATRSGVELRLTTREFDLLRFLAEHRGRVLGRTRILEAVWDTTHDPRTNVVEVYVSYLRAKVDRGFEVPLLHTVRGVGYVLDERPR